MRNYGATFNHCDNLTFYLYNKTTGNTSLCFFSSHAWTLWSDAIHTASYIWCLERGSARYVTSSYTGQQKDRGIQVELLQCQTYALRDCDLFLYPKFSSVPTMNTTSGSEDTLRLPPHSLSRPSEASVHKLCAKNTALKCRRWTYQSTSSVCKRLFITSKFIQNSDTAQH